LFSRTSEENHPMNPKGLFRINFSHWNIGQNGIVFTLMSYHRFHFCFRWQAPTSMKTFLHQVENFNIHLTKEFFFGFYLISSGNLQHKTFFLNPEASTMVKLYIFLMLGSVAAGLRGFYSKFEICFVIIWLDILCHWYVRKFQIFFWGSVAAGLRGFYFIKIGNKIADVKLKGDEMNW